MGSSNYVLIGMAVLVPLMRHDLNLATTEIGAVIAVPFLVAAICSVPASALIHARGAATAAGIAQILAATATGVVAVAHSAALLFLGSCLYGICHGIVNPAANVLSTGAVPARGRAFATSVKQTGVTVGGALAGLTLPALGTAFGWRDAILVPGVLALVVAAWAFAFGPPGSSGPLILSDRPASVDRRKLAFYGFAMAGVQGSLSAYLAVYLVDNLSASPGTAGLGVALLLGAGSVGRLFWGALSDRAENRLKTLRVVAIASAAFLAFLAVGPHELVWPCLLLSGLCSVGWNGTYNTVVAEAAGPRGVGRATSYALLFLYAGSVTFPPLFGLVIAHLSWAGFWAASAAGAAAAGVLLK